jgi:acetoin utilization protein AcuB
MPKNMRVADIMTRDPVVLSEEDNLERIQEGMEDFHFRHIPVVDGDRLVGLISQRDILRQAVSGLDRAATAQQRDRWLQEHTFVAQVMHRDVKTATPDMPIATAARIMLDQHIGSLPVVENDRLVGIVTETDMLKLLTNLLEQP